MSRSWKRFYQILGSALLILAAIVPLFAMQDCSTLAQELNQSQSAVHMWSGKRLERRSIPRRPAFVLEHFVDN